MTKSNIFKITLLPTLLIAIIIGFKNAPKPVTKTVEAAKAKSFELSHLGPKQNPLDSIIEYLEYKGEVVKKIRQNGRKIANLKEKINVGEMGIENDYRKPLDELEQRNLNLSSRIQQYKEGDPQNWETFRHQFNKDINAIDKTISLIADISYSKN